jgi:hypothetical protein
MNERGAYVGDQQEPIAVDREMPKRVIAGRVVERVSVEGVVARADGQATVQEAEPLACVEEKAQRPLARCFIENEQGVPALFVECATETVDYLKSRIFVDRQVWGRHGARLQDARAFLPPV